MVSSTTIQLLPFDGEVRVPAKGVEALEFLFRQVGWYGEGGKGSFSESDVLFKSRIGG